MLAVKPSQKQAFVSVSYAKQLVFCQAIAKALQIDFYAAYKTTEYAIKALRKQILLSVLCAKQLQF